MENKDNNSKFNIIKRVLAIVLVIALLLLYASTLYFAITDNPETMNCFWASVGLTIFVPVLLYAYQLAYRVLKGKGVKAEDKEKNSEDKVE